VEKNIIQKSLNDHYDTFTGKAAEGRGVPVEEIKKVASGRVWTGEQAVDKKLVDVLGGFDDAVKIAATKAGVQDDYVIRYYPPTKSFFEELLETLEEDAKADQMKAELGEYYHLYRKVQDLKKFQGAQARMPFEFEIH
jgi:protease-4